MKRGMTLMALLMPLAWAQGNVLMNETWADGDRLNQDLGNNSMAWHSSASASNVVAGVGSLTQNTGSGGRHIVASFTSPGTPATLADGDMLQVKFTVMFNRATPLSATNDFRMGVWDSQGLRVDADSHGGTGTSTVNAAFVNYTGYIFAGGVDATRPISLRKKNAGTDGILLGSTSVYTTMGSTVSDSHTTLAPNTDYAGMMTLARTGSSLVVTYSMDLGLTNYASISRTDDTAPHFSFDTVAFLVGSNVMDGFTLKQVEISLVPVPEPGMIAALLGGLSLAGVLIARRRR